MAVIENMMTIDVEDYYHVSAFEGVVEKKDWSSLESRVDVSTRKVLSIFDQHDVKATFFILGWVAEKYPELVRVIADKGHEVASHGMHHQRVTALDRGGFTTDLRDSKKLLEDITGQAVIGYRAPSFSFNKNNHWVYEVLAETGYAYSSSVYPVKHDHYGIPDAPRFPYKETHGVMEFPMSTLPLGSRIKPIKNFPISGGGFFRLYPYGLTRWAIQQFNQRDQQPYIFYLHPWEVDPQQPRIPGLSKKSKFRHYLNLEKTEARLTQLAKDFQWNTMASQLASYQDTAGRANLVNA